MLYDPKWEVQVETKPIEPWRRILLNAADFMERRGHVKGSLCDDDGRVCVIAAINFVDYGAYHWGIDSDASTIAWDRLCKHIGGSPIAFNNSPDRTGAEIIATMRACANEC